MSIHEKEIRDFLEENLGRLSSLITDFEDYKNRLSDFDRGYGNLPWSLSFSRNPSGSNLYVYGLTDPK